MHTHLTLTQSEAARRLGLDPSNLQKLIREGRVETVETADGLRLVPLKEVERIRKERER